MSQLIGETSEYLDALSNRDDTIKAHPCPTEQLVLPHNKVLHHSARILPYPLVFGLHQGVHQVTDDLLDSRLYVFYEPPLRPHGQQDTSLVSIGRCSISIQREEVRGLVLLFLSIGDLELVPGEEIKTPCRAPLGVLLPEGLLRSMMGRYDSEWIRRSEVHAEPFQCEDHR